MTRLLIVAAVLLAALVARPAGAQIAVGTKVGEPAPVTAGGYDSLGHRDPFVSLITPRRLAPTGIEAARPGLGLVSISLADVVVTGIVRKGDLMMAILQGADRQSFVAKIKDKLADGVVKSIDAHGVVFMEFSEPGSTVRPQELRKVLRSAAEVNR